MLLKHIKNNPGDAVILLAIIPVVIQAGIMVGITFYGFGIAALSIAGII